MSILKNSYKTLPEQNWLGKSLDEVYFLDEVINALEYFQPEVKDIKLAKTASLIASARSYHSENLDIYLTSYVGSQLEIGRHVFLLENILGHGEDGVVFLASTKGITGALKISWSFDRRSLSQSGEDCIQCTNTLCEREALMLIAHDRAILPIENRFIIPRLYLHEFLNGSPNEERMISSALFMEYCAGASIEQHLAEHSAPLASAISVSLGILNACKRIGAIGKNDDGDPYGIYRFDTTISNFRINQNGLPIILDFGGAQIPHFTGVQGNPTLSVAQQMSLNLENSSSVIKKSIAQELQQISNPAINESKLISTLKDDHLTLTETMEQLEKMLAKHELAGNKLPKLSRSALKLGRTSIKNSKAA